ncbi:coatomer epsilon subunit-domain-containing protein, partial [Gigaspora rosea]
INEGSSRTSVSESAKLERKIYQYRAYIAQRKHNIVITKIKDSDPIDLRVVKFLVQSKSSSQASETKKEEALEELKEILGDTANLSNATVQIIVGMIYYHEGLFEDALKVLFRHNRDLECVALIIQIYLQLDRLDLAKREIAAAKTWAEDAMLAQLIKHHLIIFLFNFIKDGDKYQEAYYIYEEIAQSPSSNTVKVLNGQAVCNIHLGRYPEAENLLLRVEALNKSKSDPDTLVNLIMISNLIGKPTEVINRQLKEVAPNHVFLQDLDLKTSLFDRSGQRFAFV